MLVACENAVEEPDLYTVDRVAFVQGQRQYHPWNNHPHMHDHLVRHPRIPLEDVTYRVEVHDCDARALVAHARSVVDHGLGFAFGAIDGTFAVVLASFCRRWHLLVASPNQACGRQTEHPQKKCAVDGDFLELRASPHLLLY